MAQNLTVKPAYLNNTQVMIDGVLTLLTNNLTQAQLLAIWQKPEYNYLITIEYVNVQDSFPENFPIDPNLFNAYDSGQISHDKTKTNYPVNTTGQYLNETRGVVDKSAIRTKTKPALIADFSLTKKIPKYFAFSRNTTATYIDAAGRMKLAKANEARFTHDIDTGESLGLLIEEARSNYLTERTLNAGSILGYYKKPATLQTIDILGDSAATFFPLSEANGGPSSNVCGFVTDIPAIAVGTKVAVSIWAKADVPCQIGFGIDDGNVSHITISQEWRKYEYVGVKTGNRGFMISVGLSINTGVSLSTNLYFCCPQVEIGAFATSYIPNIVSGTVATRNADVCSISMSSNKINRKFGAISISTRSSKNSSSATGFPSAVVATGNDAILIESLELAVGSWDGSTQHSVLSPLTVEINTAVFAWTRSLKKLAFNSYNVVSSPLNTTYFWGSNIIYFGSRAGGVNSINNAIKRVVIYSAPLADAEIRNICQQSSHYSPSANNSLSISDVGEASMMNVKDIVNLQSRQEFSIDGTGASVTRNIRRPYDFYFELVDTTGYTALPSQPPVTLCSANTDYPLTVTLPVGKTLTYAIVPNFDN